MKRREEILRKAMNSYPDCPERGFGTGDYEYPEFHDDEREAFIEGAQWADKTMIEKAYKWILCNMPKYVKANQLEVFIKNEDMANDFKRAMEE